MFLTFRVCLLIFFVFPPGRRGGTRDWRGTRGAVGPGQTIRQAKQLILLLKQRCRRKQRTQTDEQTNQMENK